MEYALIAWNGDVLKAFVLDGANGVLSKVYELEHQGFGRFRIFDGPNELTRAQMESMNDASRS